MRAVLLCLSLVVLAAPASASAATLTKSGSTLTYTATAAKTNQVTFSGGSSTVTVTRAADDNDPITPSGCSPGGGGYTCTGISQVVVDAGDGDDLVTATGLTPAAQISGGAGNDSLRGGNGADTIGGGDGDDYLEGADGNDVLDGGAGDDQLTPGAGTDKVTGGPGIDKAFYNAAAATSLTLDGVANDGVAGENDAIDADVEDVQADGSAPVTMVGSAGPNALSSGDGNDTVAGGDGGDTIDTGAGDDTVNAADGYADRVVCGPGTDVVNADTLDLISASCETVNVIAQANAADDKPPTVAWTSPKTGAKLGAKTTLTVTTADDHQLALVRFLDDDRVICEDAAAPYTCDYAPRGEDIGRDTLTAIAVDNFGQTASAQLAVVVNRFKPDIDLSVRPRGSTFTAGGSVDAPDNLTRKQACAGTVTVKVKSGSKTVTTKKGKLTSRCTFSIRGLKAKGSKLRFVASYGGNAYLTSRSSKTVSAKK